MQFIPIYVKGKECKHKYCDCTCKFDAILNNLSIISLPYASGWFQSDCYASSSGVCAILRADSSAHFDIVMDDELT